MSYESQITQLAKGVIRHHGALKEVVFLQTNKNYLLVFSDGTVLSPTSDESLRHEYGSYEGYGDIAKQLGGTHPFSLLAFGYSGTGSQCFSIFLRAAGFESANVENIKAPLKLRADGSQVSGTKRDDLIEWEDGSETPSIGTQKKVANKK